MDLRPTVEAITADDTIGTRFIYISQTRLGAKVNGRVSFVADENFGLLAPRDRENGKLNAEISCKHTVIGKP